ncbi:hypothetical protein [Stenotrophomonas maltophilia]|uniref:hypothetical protein n=1 Tax=Stenotrophomonas maltophilia TaxID=40324 RepID=UPI0039C35016
MTPHGLARVVFASASLLFASCAVPDGVVSDQYETRLEAEEKGAFARGWLPEEMPASAADIREVHNVDSNEMWIGFSYSGSDERAFLKGCTPTSTFGFPDSRRTRRNAPWWPDDLLSDAPHPDGAGGHEVYACEAMRHAGNALPAGAVVLLARRKIYYWVSKR